VESVLQVLLAMQKVEGSNPFSRFGEGSAFAGLFMGAQFAGAFAPLGTDCGLAGRFTVGVRLSACSRSENRSSNVG